MDKALLAEMLKELSPAELRVLKYEMAGGHQCTNSSSLYHCCGEARCEACHIPHLKAKHDEPALWAYEKFVDKWQLTWQGYVPPKQKKVNKVTRTKRARTERPKLDPIAAANQVGDDDLDKVLAILEAKLRK